MLTILCIDNDGQTLMLCETVLRAEGFHVFVAHTGAEGISLTDQEKCDAVVLDYLMPTCAVKRLREFSGTHTQNYLLSSARVSATYRNRRSKSLTRSSAKVILLCAKNSFPHNRSKDSTAACLIFPASVPRSFGCLMRKTLGIPETILCHVSASSFDPVTLAIPSQSRTRSPT